MKYIVKIGYNEFEFESGTQAFHFAINARESWKNNNKTDSFNRVSIEIVAENSYDPNAKIEEREDNE